MLNCSKTQGGVVIMLRTTDRSGKALFFVFVGQTVLAVCVQTKMYNHAEKPAPGCVYINLNIHMYFCIYICALFMYSCVCRCACVRMCVCVCIRACACMCAYVYVQPHIPLHRHIRLSSSSNPKASKPQIAAGPGRQLQGLGRGAAGAAPSNS